jgi:hypothetical protein
MALRYWKDDGSGAWDTAATWFSDPGLTVPAAAPGPGDDVIVGEWATAWQLQQVGPAVPVVIKSLSCNGQVALGAGITVTESAHFGEYGVYDGSLLGDVTGGVFAGPLYCSGFIWGTGVSFTVANLITRGVGSLPGSCTITFLSITTPVLWNGVAYHARFILDEANDQHLTGDIQGLMSCPDPFAPTPVAADTTFVSLVTLVDPPLTPIRNPPGIFPPFFAYLDPANRVYNQFVEVKAFPGFGGLA